MNSLKLDINFYSILCLFSGCFTAPGLENFIILMTGWVLCVRRKTVTGMIEAAGVANEVHHERFHRFFSKGSWNLDDLSGILFILLVNHFVPEGEPIKIAGDDTLAKKTGSKIFGAGKWRDAVLSTKSKVVTRWGLDFVVLSLSAEVSLWPGRVIGFPFMAWLHRKEKTFEEPYQYRTCPQILVEMISIVAGWLPNRIFYLVVDGGYANDVVFNGLPSNVVLISRTRSDAALYQPAPVQTKKKKGRPRKKGDKLPKPKQMAISSSLPYNRVNVLLYGEEKTLEIYTFVGLWYHVAKDQLLRFVIVRDPKHPENWRCLFSTDINLSAITIIQMTGGRWSIEVAFREAKQYMGAEHPQSRLPKAVERQFPLGLMLVSLVKFWFITYGYQTPFAVMSCGAWNLRKTQPSFSDMLAALRRSLWSQRIIVNSASDKELQKMIELLTDQLARAA